MLIAIVAPPPHQATVPHGFIWERSTGLRVSHSGGTHRFAKSAKRQELDRFAAPHDGLRVSKTTVTELSLGTLRDFRYVSRHEYSLLVHRRSCWRASWRPRAMDSNSSVRSVVFERTVVSETTLYVHRHVGYWE